VAVAQVGFERILVQEARGRRSATSGTGVLNGGRLMRRFGSMQWLLGGAVVLGLLASVAGDLTAEDLVYSDAWGTQSACSGCSYIKGNVVEKPQEEVLQIDCICPPQVHRAPALPTCSPNLAARRARSLRPCPLSRPVPTETVGRVCRGALVTECMPAGLPCPCASPRPRARAVSVPRSSTGGGTCNVPETSPSP
jgi:hypothetical protein